MFIEDIKNGGEQSQEAGALRAYDNIITKSEADEPIVADTFSEEAV